MAKYRYTYDEGYNLEGMRKYNRQGFSWYYSVAFVAVVGLMSFLAAVDSIADGDWFPALIFNGLVLLFISGHLLSGWLVKQQARKSPAWMDEVEFTLSRDGVHVISALCEFTRSWEFYTKARRVRRGFLLYEYPKDCYWLPDESLIDGTVEEMDALFKLNIRDYKPFRRVFW